MDVRRGGTAGRGRPGFGRMANWPTQLRLFSISGPKPTARCMVLRLQGVRRRTTKETGGMHSLLKVESNHSVSTCETQSSRLPHSVRQITCFLARWLPGLPALAAIASPSIARPPVDGIPSWSQRTPAFHQRCGRIMAQQGWHRASWPAAPGSCSWRGPVSWLAVVNWATRLLAVPIARQLAVGC